MTGKRIFITGVNTIMNFEESIERLKLLRSYCSQFGDNSSKLNVYALSCAIKFMDECKECSKAVNETDDRKSEEIRRLNVLLKNRPDIVRCKDCIHYRYYGLSPETVSECRIDHCENPDADWFCADGKRGDVK